MQPVKYPNLPLDTDTTDLQLVPGRARYRLNCRVGGSKNGSVGSVENVLGTGSIVDRWVSTRSFTAECAAGTFGLSQTVIYTYTSFISQADADAVALAKATAAAIAALVCTAIAPDWQFDLTTLRCKTVSGVNTGEREAKKKDMAVGSATEGQYQNAGEYFVYDTNLTACPIYYTYPMYERYGSFPEACTMSVTPTNYYSDSPTWIVGTRLFTDTALTSEVLSGFYKRQASTQVAGYTPGAGNGIDSIFNCP